MLDALLLDTPLFTLRICGPFTLANAAATPEGIVFCGLVALHSVLVFRLNLLLHARKGPRCRWQGRRSTISPRSTTSFPKGTFILQLLHYCFPRLTPQLLQEKHKLPAVSAVMCQFPRNSAAFHHIPVDSSLSKSSNVMLGSSTSSSSLPSSPIPLSRDLTISDNFFDRVLGYRTGEPLTEPLVRHGKAVRSVVGITVKTWIVSGPRKEMI